MPSRALFERYSDEQLKKVLRIAKEHARREVRGAYAMALDFLEGRQVAHVTSELAKRYKYRQSASDGQTLRPVVVPITQRYVAESATIYNHKVTRSVINADGSKNEQMTETLNRELGEIGYDERLHRVEELQEVVGDVGLWFQIKAGAMRPVVVLPQDIYPVAPEDGKFCDPTDQRDYAGFIVQVVYDLADNSQGGNALYALLTPAETIYYSGKTNEPYEPTGPLNRFDNPYSFEQTIDTPDQRGAVANLPLQPLTIWHKRIPVGSVLSFPDADIVTANMELNIQWTLLLDTMRTQGWATPIIKSLSHDSPGQHAIPHGAQYPVTIAPGEEFAYVSAAPPLDSLVAAIKAFVATLAIAHRQSPNDFSIDGLAPQSGFAKLVDSLPKVEARQERAARLRHTEEKIAWPRIAAIGAFLGWDGFSDASIRGTSLSVEFADLEYPRTIDEEIKRDEFNLAKGLTTKAEILASRKGITKEEAEALLEEMQPEEQETEDTEEPEQQQAPGQRPPVAGILGQLIAQRKSAQKE